MWWVGWDLQMAASYPLLRRCVITERCNADLPLCRPFVSMKVVTWANTPNSASSQFLSTPCKYLIELCLVPKCPKLKWSEMQERESGIYVPLECGSVRATHQQPDNLHLARFPWIHCGGMILQQSGKRRLFLLVGE